MIRNMGASTIYDVSSICFFTPPHGNLVGTTHLLPRLEGTGPETTGLSVHKLAHGRLSCKLHIDWPPIVNLHQHATGMQEKAGTAPQVALFNMRLRRHV